MSLRDDVTAFVEESIPANPDAWCKRFKKPKIVHDALWGTFQVQPHEMAILDTPLLQRLRYIHQTGGVYLTYPCALHTRFEHTLGVLCQADRLCSALQAGDKRIDTSFVDNVRYAALLHDTGHGPFSHTSEQYYSQYPEVGQLKKGKRFRHSGAGEILSSLIVESRPMQDFVAAVNKHFSRALDCSEIANMITGGFGSDKIYRSEIVHGPFDADKLDYMHRDGLFSGLRMHVDLDRLYHSIKILTAAPENSGGDATPEKQTRIAGSVSGISPLTQIMFNKMLLFTGIYHHHKVRAVDCMLWAVFDLARNLNARVGGYHLQSAADFLRITDDALLTPELSDCEEVQKILRSIRNRNLWKRALIMSRRTIPEAMRDGTSVSDKGQFSSLTILAGNRAQNIYRRRKLAKVIWETAGRPCREHEVWLDVPTPPPIDEAKKMWIEAPGADQPQTLGKFVPIDEWVELYGMNQWRAHVFCPEEYVIEIGEAAKSVFLDKFALEFLPVAQPYKCTGE